MCGTVVETHSLEETQDWGKQFAQRLRPGDVVALIGELGTGKTHLAQAIAVGLGVSAEQVTSPTFTLIQEYEGRFPVVHLDVYRLKDLDEFTELGADELLGSENVCLIEWADRVAELLPRNRLEIRLEATGPNSRRIEVRQSPVE